VEIVSVVSKQISRNFTKDLNRENNFREVNNPKWINYRIVISILTYA